MMKETPVSFPHVNHFHTFFFPFERTCRVSDDDTRQPVQGHRETLDDDSRQPVYYVFFGTYRVLS